MTNKPFIAFSQITGQWLYSADTAEAARTGCVERHRLDDDRFLEVLDCGENAEKIRDRDIPLSKARELHPTVFRGDGYDAAAYEAAIEDARKILAPRLAHDDEFIAGQLSRSANDALANEWQPGLSATEWAERAAKRLGL